MIRYRIFYATLVVGLVLLFGTIGVTAGQQRAGRGSANQLAQQSNTDAAATLFRSGRDLITDQEWAKAQAKFDQLVSAYPDDKNIDAALYWTAYAQNKLSQIDQCRQTIKQLLEKYPNTTWKADAKLLLAQTLGTTAQAYVVDTTESGVATIRPVDSVVAYAPAAPMPPHKHWPTVVPPSRLIFIAMKAAPISYINKSLQTEVGRSRFTPT